MGVTTPLPLPGRRQRGGVTATRARGLGAAVVVFVALLAIANVVFRDPTFVDRVSVDNRTGYDIHVDVAGDDGHGSLPLGVAVQRCTTVFDLVVDQGSTWRVSFRSQGVDAAQITMTRDELQRANWTIQVPASIETDLPARQVPRPPAQGCRDGAS